MGTLSAPDDDYYSLAGSLPGTRIGIDVVEVRSIAVSIERFGARYLDRIYTGLEQQQAGGAPERIAARFAGKEAVMKVLRVPAGDAVPFRDIEILSSSAGVPCVRLGGAAKRSALAQRLVGMTISLSHEAGTAVAVALGSFAPGPDGPDSPA